MGIKGIHLTPKEMCGQMDANLSDSKTRTCPHQLEAFSQIVCIGRFLPDVFGDTVLDVQRTGPIVRAIAVISGSLKTITIELPHLHHDVLHFVPKANLRLRLMQFSVFPAKDTQPSVGVLEAPLLIGRARSSARISPTVKKRIYQQSIRKNYAL